MTLSTKQRLLASAIASVGVPIVEAFGAMYHWREDGAEYLDPAALGGRPPIIAFWHGRILGATLYFRDRNFVVLTSQNFDGEWISRLIHRFGYTTSRGSTSRGGARALVQLRRDMAAGQPAAITVDGPRGPARVAQAGAVWLAGATGNPILPCHIEASRFWTANSWDQHQVPRPGSEVAISIGKPFEVSNTDQEVVEARCRDLESELAAAEARARALVLG